MDMTHNEVVYTARQRGFTHVRTYGGEISLEEWTPYGKTEGHTISFALETGAIFEHFGQPTEGLVLGIWHLS